jgi:hypothetical protein
MARLTVAPIGSLTIELAWYEHIGGGMIRRMIFVIITIVGLGAPPSPTAAQTIKGSGNDNCGDWLAYKVMPPNKLLLAKYCF